MLGMWESSRGSREPIEWFGFLDACRNTGTLVYVSSHKRTYDVRIARDWKVLAEDGVNSAHESNIISERSLRGIRRSARKGRPHGKLQFGFIRVYDETGKFVEQKAHPEQAPIVAEMVRRIAAGDTLATIAGDLNKRGVTMPGGQPWHGRFVRQTVLRPSYAGRRIHQGQDVGPASWDAIVDVDQWHKAVGILTRPERRTTSRGTELAHWLTNAITCGTCRTTKLHARTGGTKRHRTTYVCDTCGMVVSAPALENYVEEMLLARLSRPDALTILARRSDDAATTAAERELEDLNDQLAEWRTLAKARKVSPASFADFEADLLPRIDRAREALRRLTMPPEDDDLSMVDIPERWPGFSPVLKRRYARALIELVVHPAPRRGPIFDSSRLDGSRWVGDTRTWGELA